MGVFRKEYKELTAEQKEFVSSVKTQAEILYSQIEASSKVADGRCIAVAKTKLEEAIMWAVKGITS